MCSFVDWLIRGGQLVGWTDKIFDQPILLRFGKKKGPKQSLTSYIQGETVEADRYILAMVYPHSATS